jgi:outer membrane protein
MYTIMLYLCALHSRTLTSIKQVKKTYFFIATLIGLLFASCDQKGTTTQQDNNATASEKKNSTEPIGAVKVAYVNMDTLAMRYDFYLDKRNKMTEDERNFRKRMSEKQLNLRSEYENFAKRANAGLVSEIEIQKTQLEFQQKERQLEEEMQARQEGLFAQNQKVTQELYERIRKFLATYKEERGFNLVLGYQEATVILYAEDNMDITEPVIDALNKAYADEKAAQ